MDRMTSTPTPACRRSCCLKISGSTARTSKVSTQACIIDSSCCSACTQRCCRRLAPLPWHRAKGKWVDHGSSCSRSPDCSSRRSVSSQVRPIGSWSPPTVINCRGQPSAPSPHTRNDRSSTSSGFTSDEIRQG